MIDPVDALIERDVEVNTAILAFADRFQDVPVAWGHDDCSMFAAMWAAEYSGRHFSWFAYDSEAEARALIENAGGLVNVWTQAAEINGIAPVRDKVQAGDVGVIHTFLHGDVGCIFMKYGSVAVIRAETGYRTIGIREKHVRGAWRIA